MTAASAMVVFAAMVGETTVVLGYECRRMPLHDGEECARELQARFRSLEQRGSAPGR